MKRSQMRRSLSEPPPIGGIYRMHSSSLSRERKRVTIVNFEKGKDIVSAWINEWSSNEVCAVLQELVRRCNLHQMEFLWTSLESVPHNDFLHRAINKFPSIPFQPLSTPISRAVKLKLERSKYKENKALHRVQSMYITSTITQQSGSMVLSDQLISRRRRMSISLTNPTVTPSSLPSTPAHDTWSTRRRSHIHSKQFMMPYEGMTFLRWYSSLNKDWEQQEILQLIIWTLNEKELYCLAIVLLSRQYRDFIGDLPLPIVHKILSFVPGKDILTGCTVSRVWHSRCCIDDTLWEMKCGQVSLGVVHNSEQTWKQLFIDNIKLNRNWRLGRSRAVMSTCNDRILCVCMNTDDGLCATGGNDRVIRVWRLTDGKQMNTIQEQARVWSLTFYGLNLLISGCSDCMVKIWNIRTDKCLKVLEGHSGTIWSLKRKGELLITGSHDKTAIIWNIRQCKYKCHLIGHTGAVFGVDLDNDCTLAFTCSGDKTIRVWTLGDGACSQVINSANSQPIQSLQYNRSMVAYASGTSVYLWSLSCNKLVRTFAGHEKRVECVNFEADGSNAHTIISGGKDGFIKYWNTESGNCIRTLGYQSGSINGIDRDSTRVVCVTDSGNLTVYDFNPATSSAGCCTPQSVDVSRCNSLTTTEIEAKANLMISQHRSLMKHKQKMMLLNTKL